jgi:hypothetical protein
MTLSKRTILPVAAFILSVSVALAQANDYNLPAWVVANGGGLSSGGTYALAGTTGQPLVTTSQAGNLTIISGFWGDDSGIKPISRAINIYLPLIVKE